MSTYLYRTGRWSFLRRRYVLAFWVVVAIGAVALSLLAGGKTVDDYTVPGQSKQASDLLKEKLPDYSGGQTLVVFGTQASVTDDNARTVEVYFAPTAPAGKKSNWVYTAPWRSWCVPIAARDAVRALHSAAEPEHRRRHRIEGSAGQRHQERVEKHCQGRHSGELRVSRYHLNVDGGSGFV